MNPQSSNPSFTEEKALFLLEQALVADESLAKKLLEQAVKMTFLNFKYTDVNLIKEKATLPNCAVQWGKGRAASVERRKLCFDIMCAVLVLARKHQIWQLAFEVAGIILDSDWMLDESTYHLKQQVEAAMIKGTCLIQMLGVLRTPPPESGTTVPSDDGSAASTPPLLHAHHQLVVDAFLNAHKLSQKIANIDVRERLGFNSVVYLHNYFVMVSRNVRNYEPWMPTYQRLFEKLRPLDRFVDSDLYMGVCEVLARAILAAYSRVYGSSDEKEVKKKPAAKASSTKAAAAAEKAIGVDLDSIELGML